MRALLLIALRASGGRGPHAEAARNVVLAILLAQMLAGAEHDGPPHPACAGAAAGRAAAIARRAARLGGGAPPARLRQEAPLPRAAELRLGRELRRAGSGAVTLRHPEP